VVGGWVPLPTNIAAAVDHDRTFYLWGAIAPAMIGRALRAHPKLPVGG